MDLGAVYETLFTHNVLHPALPPRGFLTVLDYSIAFRFTQCDTDRLGRVMNLVKTDQRSTLGDINFPASVFVCYNAPPIHQIDMKPIRAAFRKKHRSAVSLSDRAGWRDGGGTNVHKVMQRHAAQTKHTFFT